jgi:nickel-dependent lactate racemase
MGYQEFRVITKAWYGDEETALQFPDKWQVAYKAMPGHDAPALTDEQIRAALGAPVGALPLTEIGRGKNQVAILFDDVTRPTPTWRIVPFVLELLAKAGIEDEQIRFIAAPGNHRPLTMVDFVKKLGPDIPRRFRVYNHNPFELFEDLGKTKRGTPVLVNREVMRCDLKIGIGGILPHGLAGFGGGAKIILPGVVSIDTVKHNHLVIAGPADRRNPTVAQGKVAGNDVREDMEECARMVGLDWKIDVVFNGRRDVARLFCGDVVAEHRAAVDAAWQAYATPVEHDCDVVVANCYPIDIQVGKGLWPAAASLREAGTAVVLADSMEGESLHYLGSRFGEDYGGDGWSASSRRVARAKDIYLLAETPSRIMQEALGSAEQVSMCHSWPQVLASLTANHYGASKVAIYHYASMQLPAN